MNELEIRIDNYLLDRLSAADRQDFEAALAADPGLSEQVELARSLLMDDYMVGTLDSERRQAFEARLNSDPFLKDEVQLQQAISFKVKHGQQQQAFQAGLRKMMAETKVEDQQPGPGLKVSYLRRWSMGLAAGLALFLVAWYFLTQSHPSGLAVLKENDVHFKLDGFGTQGTTQDAQLTRFDQLFKAEKYDEALPIILAYTPKEDKHRLFEAICYIRKKTPELGRAEQVLLQNDPNRNFNNETYWFLALTYAGQEKWAECETTAEKITGSLVKIAPVQKLIETAKKNKNAGRY